MGLRLKNSSGNYVELNAPSSIATDFGLTLPVNDGDANQYLQTNGSGALSWQTVTSTEYQGPAFAATTSANQSVSPSTWTKVEFPVEVFDTDSCYDNSTNYRFTPTKAGYYQINGIAHADYTVSATVAYGGAIYKNGSTAVKYFTSGSNTRYGGTPVGAILYLNGSTDYVEFYVWMNGSGTQTYHETGRNYFSAAWVHS